jgi:hypothetical protein
LVGEPVAVDVIELVKGGISGLDDDRGERQFGESLHLERESPVGKRRGEVVEALALDRGEDRAVWVLDGVVAGGNAWGALIRSSCKLAGFDTRPNLCTPRDRGRFRPEVERASVQSTIHGRRLSA